METHEFDAAIEKLGTRRPPSNDQMIQAMRAAVHMRETDASAYAQSTPAQRAEVLIHAYRAKLVEERKNATAVANVHAYFNLCLSLLREAGDTEVKRVWQEALANFKRRAQTATLPMPGLK